MKKIIYILLIGIVAASIYFGYQSFFPKPTSSNTTMKEGVYTMAQIAEHGNKDSCWLAIDGKVYDVTSYVGSGFHPGKEAILNGCGRDATEMFNNRPNGSGAHSEKARGFLPKFLIGEIEK